MTAMRAYVVADVFCDLPLHGNPVAVFLDGGGLSGETMQRAARELNLSETVFLLPGDDGIDARVRIFTPGVELPFAGHPVLGTAFILAARSGADAVTLQTGSGPVLIRLTRNGDGAITFGEMEQPLPTWRAYDRPDDLLGALRVSESSLPIEVYDNGTPHVYVALEDADAVAQIRPDMAALQDLGAIGVSCFAHDVTHARVRTRMFGPGLGVPEDPATGSAAGPLAVHLARHERIAFSERIEIHQGEEIGRPSILLACAEGSRDRLERVLVGGGAVEVARGEYRLEGN
jgi:trans-2,3-dihydro-3-hydroxyanthranilate isomerase